MRYYYDYGYYNPFGSVFHILGIVLAVLVIIFLLKALRGRNRLHFHGMGSDGAINILREKYAKGEISKEEYESKKKDLMT